MNLNDIKNAVANKVSELSKDETTTDSLLDKARDVVDQATSGKFSAQVETAREALDKKLGEN